MTPRYDTSQIRRQDRILDETCARRLLAEGEYGVLSMQAEEGGGYGIPVSYVWDGARTIYIHCAPEGRKLRCLARCARTSFCVTGPTQVAPERFTTGYESIVAECDAAVASDDAERMHALELLLAKYCPHDRPTGRIYAAKSFARTAIVRLTIRSMSGKCKRL